MTIQTKNATIATNASASGYNWSITGTFPAANDAQRFWNNSAPVPVDTEWLRLTGFGFTIPAGATINRITVTFKMRIYASDSSEGCIYTASLLPFSFNTDQYPCPGTGAEFTANMTGGSLVWGGSPTPAEINAATFGFQVRAQWYRVNAIYQTIYVLPIPSISVDYTGGAAPATTHGMMISEA